MIVTTSCKWQLIIGKCVTLTAYQISIALHQSDKLKTTQLCNRLRQILLISLVPQYNRFLTIDPVIPILFKRQICCLVGLAKAYL